jgi:ferredoxin
MKAIVDPDSCISCGLCIEMCPDVFQWGSSGLAESKAPVVPANFQTKTKEAAEACPTEAIHLEV